MLFQREHIHIEVSSPGGSPRVVLTGPHNGAKFEIPSPGIYSISGPNQCGKTLLLKYLMGVAPVLAKRGATDTYTYVDGRPAVIRHVSDAHRAGLVAVFHEDRMFPTMTVREQLLMRHSPSIVRAVAGFAWAVSHIEVPLNWLATTAPEVFRFIEKFIPAETLLYPHKEVLRRADTYLAWWRSEGFMDRYPPELSTGALAMARLLQALVTKRIRVLFLDEAFSGVEAAVWPRLVDRLKAWQEETGAAIVVVTHNEEELIRWSPTTRYVIRDRQLVHDAGVGYSMLVAGLPAQTTETPVFEPPHDDHSGWLRDIGERIVLIVDERVRGTPAYETILPLLKRRAGRDLRMVVVEGGERNKTFDVYQRTLTKVLRHTTTRTGTFVLLGGGVTLNLGGFVAATMHRGRFRTVIIPTTVMAIADVAIGSKTGVNLGPSHNSAQKHAIGVYANPDAIVFDPAFLESLPMNERLLGLSECVKHGLLQDRALYEAALELITSAPTGAEQYYSCAKTVAKLKSRVLAHDPWEHAYGLLLQFGHLHAHSLERANGLVMPHGSAVFYGVLMDLLLNRCEDEYRRIVGVVRARSQALVANWFTPTPRALQRAYIAANGRRSSDFPVLRVTGVGEYGEPTLVPPDVMTVQWSAIEEARGTLQQDLTS